MSSYLLFYCLNSNRDDFISAKHMRTHEHKTEHQTSKQDREYIPQGNNKSQYTENYKEPPPTKDDLSTPNLAKESAKCQAISFP